MTTKPTEIDERAAGFLFPLLNNLYWVHLDIVDVCSRWVPRRKNHDERIWLASQLERESREVPMYLGRILALGREPDARFRIQDSRVRYQLLKETEDEVDMVIGMNVVAQGALGIIEHEQLYAFAPVFLAPFYDACVSMKTDLEYAKLFLSRRDRAHRAKLLSAYQRHLTEITVPEITPLLLPLAQLGVFKKTIIDDGMKRFFAIAAELGHGPEQIHEGATTAPSLAEVGRV